MEPRRIGSLEVSAAGLGCNNFGRRVGEAGTRVVVEAALEAGITLFDTAEMYGSGASEQFLGRALATRRDEAIVATKFGWDVSQRVDDVRGWIARSCAGSLRRLGMGHIDLYYYHHPHPEVDVADVLAAMNDLLDRGMVREIGCSNFSVDQLEQAGRVARERGLRPFAVVQNEYSLLQREPEHGVLEVCGRLGMAFVPYFPLASGLLTGKYRKGRPVPEGTRLGGGGKNAEEIVEPDKLDVIERLAEFATARGHTLLELALSWLVTRPGVASVIAGATSAEQVRANAAGIGSWRLSDEELADVDRVLAGA